MNLVSGNYFEIGTSHTVCQDYSLDNSGTEGSIAILADGCSSNFDSDVGARILAHAALNQIKDYSKIVNPQEIAFQSKFIFNYLRLPQPNLNATLLSISAFKRFGVQVFGDGAIVAREKDTKDLFVVDLNYFSGAPFYLQYLLDSFNLESWIEQYGKVFKYTSSYIRTNGDIEPTAERTLDSLGFDETFSFKDYDLVAVLSDGIKSFQHTDISLQPYGNTKKSDVDYLKVIRELFKFKIMGGAFVERRCNKFFKDCKKLDWSHYDDFSIAAIYKGEDDGN